MHAHPNARATTGLAIYVKTQVKDLEAEPEVTDEDGKTIGLERMVCEMFSVVNSLVDNPKKAAQKALKKTLVGQLTNVMYHVVSYAQITEDQVGAVTWLAAGACFIGGGSACFMLAVGALASCWLWERLLHKQLCSCF
jgi:hypothetical protein